MTKRVAIIGSHGLYAKYGGWDQLVRNLAHEKSAGVEYLIFNSKETFFQKIPPLKGVQVNKIYLSASGYQGIFYDFITILIAYFQCDTLVLLGAQGMPLVAILKIFSNKNIVTNVGGLEWERPKFGFFAKQYLKLCFLLTFRFSDKVILDNEHYKKFAPLYGVNKIKIIPYGGVISFELSNKEVLQKKYPFINFKYFLSISRSLEDNLLYELCLEFRKNKRNLVLISNFSNSEYGKRVLNEFKNDENIFLINGLYDKDELDLIRRSCVAYIHTHTLCGTAPSLVEMIICKRPILSVDVPQNRYTLYNEGFYFSDFKSITELISLESEYECYIPKSIPDSTYKWDTIVSMYESTY